MNLREGRRERGGERREEGGGKRGNRRGRGHYNMTVIVFILYRMVAMQKRQNKAAIRRVQLTTVSEIAKL